MRGVNYMACMYIYIRIYGILNDSLCLVILYKVLQKYFKTWQRGSLEDTLVTVILSDKCVIILHYVHVY